MPTSNLALAPYVLQLVHETDPHDTILDVGPGWGKYATLLREYLNVKPSRIDAVEAHPPYVEEHGLERLYDDVLIGDVLDLPDEKLAEYDLVLMVDVIEHIEKDAAVALLDRIPGSVIACTPAEFFSNGPGLPDSETHRSHWTIADFHATGRCVASTTYLGGHLVRLAAKAALV